MNEVKIALTGANGFIGSNIYETLRKEGINVLKLDHHVLEKPEMLNPIINTYKPSIIIHCASYGNIINQQEEGKIIQANITNLFNLLEATKHVDYEMFVNFSTSSVTLPVETMYSATKASGERICNAYATKYMKPIVSVRPFTVIGIGEPEEHLIPTLIRSCLEGEKMRFVGSPMHDFIGVNDLVEGIRLIIENYHLRGIIELGTGIQTSNEEILRIVEQVTEKKANLVRVDNMRSYDSNKWIADPTLIKSLGWKQKETITDIVEQMVYGNPKIN